METSENDFIGKRCQSCGLLLDEKEKNHNLCNICTINETINPKSKPIIYAIANEYFINKKGFNDQTIALKNALNFVKELPYWKNKQNEILSLNELEDDFNLFRTSRELFKRLNKLEEIDFITKSFDIFISYSWNGPDEELVKPLVNNLKKRGYTVWYDKDMGLKPGDLPEYLKSNIINSKNCIPIICKEYFKGDYTRFELEMLFKIKDKKHIIPIWWKDVDKEYIKQQGFCGEQIIKCACISWNQCNENIDDLTDKLEEFLYATEGFDKYNNVKLFESEAQAMRDLEQLIGEPIAAIEEFDSTKYQTYQFGFVHENNHVIAIILRKRKNGAIIKSLNLQNSFSRLRHLKMINIPLVAIPPWFGNFKELEWLDLSGGDIRIIPNCLKDLSNLRYLNIINNPIEKIESNAISIIKQLIKKNKVYQDLEEEDAFNLYLLQARLGFNDELLLNSYSCKNHKLSELDLSNKDIISLPEIIGNFSELKKLNLNHNHLKEIPESIGKISELQELNLSYNQLESLPESIGNLINLHNFDLGNNKLKSLPESIGNLEELRELDISNNKFESAPDNIITNLHAESLPNSCNNLKKLESLNLGENNLGTIPLVVFNLTKLKELKIYKNKLQSIPKRIGDLKFLNVLSLWGNAIKEIPKTIGKLTELRKLDLYENKITSIPKEIGYLVKLERLDLSNNQLNSLPESFSNLTNLIELNIGNNKLESLPSSIGNLKNLKFLYLEYNRILKLPETIINLKNIQVLDIKGIKLDELSKSVRKWINKLKKTIGIKVYI
ncbi:MAG: leucine-rich repeat domain-containing protein [Promethearchaeota archaeon]